MGRGAGRVAGGDPIFPELRTKRLARHRIVDPDEVRRRKPDVIFVSWCGKKMRKHTIVSRADWSEVPAVQADRIYEIPSTYILQPGPAAITDGLPLIADRLGAMYAQQL